MTFVEVLKMSRLAEKKGVISGDGIEEADQFPAVGFHKLQVFVDRADVCLSEPFGKT